MLKKRNKQGKNWIFVVSLFLVVTAGVAGCAAKAEDSQDEVERSTIEWADIQGETDLKSGETVQTQADQYLGDVEYVKIEEKIPPAFETDMTVSDVEQFLENMLEQNQLAEFSFEDSDSAICRYEGDVKDLDLSAMPSHLFVVYKENSGKDILFEGSLYVVEGTGDLYARVDMGNGELKLLKTGLLQGLKVSSDGEQGSNACEEEAEVDDETQFQIVCKVADVLKEREDDMFTLLFNGTRTFLSREYFSLRMVEDHETHVVTLEWYLVDIENGNVYIEAMTMEGLYYIGNIE